MENNKWGHCMHCKYFGSPAEMPLASEEAYCRHPQLSRYQLTVFGTNGCIGFELRHGLPREVEHRSHIEAPR